VRWGILVNLAVILVVSGVLLLMVFTASLERTVIDGKIEEASLLADLLEDQIHVSGSPAEMWKDIRRLCSAGSGLKPLLYDSAGNILGGCSVGPTLEKPKRGAHGQRIRVVSERFPMNLFRGAVVVVDLAGDFPHGIGSVRGSRLVPPLILQPAWKFFTAYLVLTQAALFFLGYWLFHRTIVGPIRDVASLAGKAAGITDQQDSADPGRFKGDIQRISAGLRGMITRILADREKMESLIERLREINRDLEAAQQGLIRSEKMASAGRLAAGLAHEIGNPLQIVMGYLELLQRGSEPESQTEIISRMDHELKRIHDILHKLLEFARPIHEDVQSCDINALVSDCSELLKDRKGFRNIEVEQILDPEVGQVDTEPEKIRQILVNLLFNAADAIPESGGKITMRTRLSDHNVQIEVEDTGSGIPEENLDKVFDPFFTSKEPGKGTGLGLAVCLSLVESVGGSIDIESSTGKGTTVRISLPE